MQVHARRSQFGWPGDGGLGLRLIAAIRTGRKTATCAPVVLCTAEELAETRESAGHVVTVTDAAGDPHCNVRILAVAETTWGDPDPRLVRGEGFATADEWRTAMQTAWRDVLAERGVTLEPGSVLVAEYFELAAEDDDDDGAGERPRVASFQVETFRVERGEVVAAGAGWVYAWREDAAAGRAAVVYVGATGLHPAARAEKHLRDPGPTVGRIRARYAAAGGDLAAPMTVLAVEVPVGGRRGLVRARVAALVREVGLLSPRWCGEPAGPPEESLTDDEEACARALLAALR